MKNWTNPGLTQIEEYWDRRPCNVRHSSKKVATKEWFQEVSARRYFVEPHILDFMRADSFRGKAVLELGCGIGTDAAIYAENGAEYYGIELSNESLKIAETRFQLFGLSGKFLHSSIEDFSLEMFDSPKIDLVYSFGVVHHTLEPSKALRSIVNQVSEGTEFRIMLYARNSWKSALINHGLDQPEAQDNCPIAFTYTLEEAEKFLLDSGLKVISISQDHIFQYEIEEYKNYNYVKEKWFQEMPENYINALKQELGWHLLLHAIK